MEELIKQAFLHVDIIGPHVQEGHYDLIGPNGEIILPQVWERVVEPDWTIEMRMWPMEKAQPAPPPGMFPPGVRPAPGQHQRPRSMGGAGGLPPGFPRPGGGGGVPPPPPGWAGNGPPPPPPVGAMPPGRGPRVINVGPAPEKKRQSKGGQGSMLSWMAGAKPAKKK